MEVMAPNEYIGSTHACAGPGCEGVEHQEQMVQSEELAFSAVEQLRALATPSHIRFTIKDSGERKEYQGGGRRDTEAGKIDYTLAYDGPMFDRYAAHMTKGAQKYGARNWLKFKDEEALERAKRGIARHFRQYIRGDKDEDHAAAIIFGLNVIERLKVILGLD